MTEDTGGSRCPPPARPWFCKRIELISASVVDHALFRRGVILFGVLIPFLAVAGIPYAHKHDLDNIRLWGQCLSDHGTGIYARCNVDAAVNYPAVGILATAGAARAIDSLSGRPGRKAFRQYFRYYVAIFDALNFLLLLCATRLVRFRRPELTALLLLVIPSTLTGGGVWGQIDSVLLCIGLLATISLIKAWMVASRTPLGHGSIPAFVFWVCAGAAMAASFVLVKQLSVFSIPFLAVAAAVTAVKAWWTWRRTGLWTIAAAALVFVAVFTVLDRMIFEVPDGFGGSGYYYVWTGGGSDHADKISGNGFNIWMFLGRGMLTSAHQPVDLGWGSHVVGSASPYTMGIGLYACWMVFLTFTAAATVRSLLVGEKSADGTGATAVIAAVLFVYHGLSYLGFNVLLTGTHERYMYTGYPFLLLGVMWLVEKRVVYTMRLGLFCLGAAFIYGWFVFSRIGPIPGVFFPFARHEFVASVHLFLLIMLADAWIRMWRRRSDLISLQRGQISIRSGVK